MLGSEFCRGITRVNVRQISITIKIITISCPILMNKFDIYFRYYMWNNWLPDSSRRSIDTTALDIFCFATIMSSRVWSFCYNSPTTSPIWGRQKNEMLGLNQKCTWNDLKKTNKTHIVFLKLVLPLCNLGIRAWFFH